jgi:hypothetical protein
MTVRFRVIAILVVLCNALLFAFPPWLLVVPRWGSQTITFPEQRKSLGHYFLLNVPQREDLFEYPNQKTPATTDNPGIRQEDFLHGGVPYEFELERAQDQDRVDRGIWRKEFNWRSAQLDWSKLIAESIFFWLAAAFLWLAICWRTRISPVQAHRAESPQATPEGSRGADDATAGKTEGSQPLLSHSETEAVDSKG